MLFMFTVAMLFIFLLGSGQSYELPGPETLRSLKKNVTGSSQHPEIDRFALAFAVDGSTSRVSRLCKCCAATQIQDDPWIQIDLGRLYRVETVEVIGRTDYNDSFNMAIYVSTTNTSWQGNTPAQPTLPDVPEQYHNVTFSYPVIGQFVTLQLNGNAPLCVCEVNIYSKDCSNGTYGLYCNETCGQCQDGKTCDHVTGRCTRCLPGYQLPLCTEDCSNGTYGLYCNETCGQCQDGKTCDHVTGRCTRCLPGYQLPLCTEECPQGAYGLDCNKTCGRCLDNQTCNPVTGKCAQCVPGYQFPLCKEICSSGSYGHFCNGTCGQCQGGETCDHVTGSCTRCRPGYQYPLCADECQPGSFGHDCEEECHCHGNQTCNHLTGECPDARCGAGWMGFNCSLECDDGKHGENCNNVCGHCYSGPCDRRTGECSPCSDGYTGPRCMEGKIRLRATGVEVSMSSIHAGLDATKAIDGKFVDDPETCRCCSETANEYISWWQVDLGRPFFLKQIIVYGRHNENIFRQLVGFTIVTSFTNEFPDYPVHIQNGEIQDSKVLILLPDVAARYLKIQRFGILTICEVELVPSDIICPVHTYGRDCTPCGPCRNGSCDPVTGDCPSGCYYGYGGNRCEKLTVNNDIIGLIGATLAGVVTTLLVVGLIVALFRYKKRRSRLSEEPSVRWEKQPTKESAYDTLEVQEVVLGKDETYDNPM